MDGEYVPRYTPKEKKTKVFKGKLPEVSSKLLLRYTASVCHWEAAGGRVAKADGLCITADSRFPALLQTMYKTAAMKQFGLKPAESVARRRALNVVAPSSFLRLQDRDAGLRALPQSLSPRRR